MHVKKHYVTAHICLHNSRFCSLHGDDSSIVLKNVHFETHFQKFTFSGPQNAVAM